MKINTFEDVRLFLSNIECINSGGCAISALAMYRWLEKHNRLHEDTKIIYLYKFYRESEYKQNESFLKGEKDECTSCSHAILKHNGLFFDCEEIVNVSDYKFIQEINNLDFIVKSINIVHVWNCFFDRKNINKIERELLINLFKN